MIRRHLAAFCFVFLGAVLSQACGQTDGQVCQQDGDCASGLQCLCRIGTGTRGLCRAPGSTMCTNSTTDTGPRTDAFVEAVDADLDGGPDADLDANVDANVDGGPDADLDADVDGGSDAGSDAGTDGGSDGGDDDAGNDAG